MAQSFKMSFLSLETYSYKIKIRFDLCTIEWLNCSHGPNQFVTKVSFYWSQSSLSSLRVLVILDKLLHRTKSIEILYWKHNNVKGEIIVPDWPADLWFLSLNVVSWKHFTPPQQDPTYIHEHKGIAKYPCIFRILEMPRINTVQLRLVSTWEGNALTPWAPTNILLYEIKLHHTWTGYSS